MTPARYCPKCGAKTVLVYCKGEFDPHTGKEIVWVNLRCQKVSVRNPDHYVERDLFGCEVKRMVESPELTWWTQGEGSK